MDEKIIIERLVEFLKYLDYCEEYIKEVKELLEKDIDLFEEIVNQIYDEINDEYLYESIEDSLEDMIFNEKEYLENQYKYNIELLLLKEICELYSSMINGNKIKRKYLN